VFLLRWIMYACAFIVGIGLLSIALGGMNEMFDLGIWQDDYPGIFSQRETEQGNLESEPVSYGTFAGEAGILVGIATVIGAPLHYFLGDRAF